ncbi:MAG TPA: DUF1272 domain-containing protein [Thermoplasmata archaeon]|nr:DUF1272 domain-containing protein [Thermoplasmata archaeon]
MTSDPGSVVGGAGRAEPLPADLPSGRASPPPEGGPFKPQCERCSAPLAIDSEAYVCGYACTWCRSCAEGFRWVCPNCQGALHQRPRTSAKSGEIGAKGRSGATVPGIPRSRLPSRASASG